MASTSPLRWCLRAGSRGFAPRGRTPTNAAAAVAAALPIIPRRVISTTKARNAPEGGEDGDQKKGGKLQPFEPLEEEMELFQRPNVKTLHDAVMLATTPEEREQAGYDETRGQQFLGGPVEKLRRTVTTLNRSYNAFKPKPFDFWNEDTMDEDMIVDEEGSDEFEEDEIMPAAHAKLEDHRDMREYARIAIWEMPLLSKLAKPFEPPTEQQPLRWRYTTYMGEWHPAEKKVVVEFCPDDLALTDVQRRKLTKLAGARYNPEKGTIKMSCESFEHPAQNKRYLSDLIAKLIAEAKDPKDTFEDIPLDTRHHKSKTKYSFPKEWRMTEERRQQLMQIRKQAYELDTAKRASGEIVDGTEKIQQSIAAPAKDSALDQALADMVAVKVPRGKQSAAHRFTMA
ncbi:hypothetical protein RB595_002667 [Gaeumannomyces hyphopodioides]